MNSAFRFMRDPLAAVAAILRLLGRRRDGNVAIIFGLAAIPVIIGAGMAMDTARAYMVKIRLGAALDAAALAIGSQTNQPTATLTTDLNNYFFNNYCKAVPAGTAVTQCSANGTVSAETSITVQATTDISAAKVSYQATATVPTTFMKLVGVSNLTVSVTSQTTKFPGMEIAVVLDNTGSMLCNGAATAASNYNPCGPTTSDSNCTAPTGANPSRICTLIPAAQQFVTTLQNAISGPQSIYMSIIPYVTQVNPGSVFCTSATSCTNITTDAASGDFTDVRGYIIPVVQITGNTTVGNSTVSSVAMFMPSGSVSGSAAVRAGMIISGPGIPSGTTVSSVSGTSITLSQNATLTYTGAVLALGTTPTVASNPLIVLAPTNSNSPLAGTWHNTTTISAISPSDTGAAVGMFVGSSTTGIPSGDTIATVNSTSQITLQTAASAASTQTGKSFYISAVKGNTAGSTTISSIAFASGTDCTGATRALSSSIVPGMLISGNGIPANTYVSAVNATSITISNAATSTVTSNPLILTNQGGNTTSASNAMSCVSLPSVPAVGTVISGNGIPVNTTITAASSTAAQYAAGTGTLTISQNATLTNNTELNIFTPITYATGWTGSSTTANWAGCVVEPTSSAENASGTGVLTTTGNPDTSEPASGTKWYPFYWTSDSQNTWSSSSARQDTTTEIQGSLSTYDGLDGPNQGCPSALLPLTDMTIPTGLNAINNAISAMWPRDAGGTQVHVGMIWGWRVLSPNGPFAAVNGHPLDYATAASQGWQKIVVLMTDGSEEWPFAGEYTGLGSIQDGKIGTTTYTSAPSNLNTRLSTLCTNMLASSGNFSIYTIGLGNDGANNTQLQNCAGGRGGSFQAATPSNLTTVFQNIANSIIHLRLTQ